MRGRRTKGRLPRSITGALLVAALAAAPPAFAADPVVTSAPAQEVGWNSAVLGGTIDPLGADTTWIVEYGESESYGQVDGYETVSGSEPETPVSVRVKGLQPGTTYHYRLSAADDFYTPTVLGEDLTFTTPAEDTPTAIALAPAADPAQVTGGAWLTRPPLFLTSGVLAIPFSGFPLDGPGFAAISTGRADDVTFPGTLADGSGGGAALPERGPGAEDVSVLQVGLDVPAGANCLSFAFRFLTEETPDGGNPFNDAFLAELDASTWTTTSTTVSAPRNFAFGPSGQVVTVNGLANAPTTQAAAAGTPFDWATPVLRASTPITPGAHTLYLSIFDQGDAILDSAVLLDRLQLTTTAPSACAAGVVDDVIPLGTVAPGFGTGGTPAASAGVSAAPPAGAPEPLLGARVVGEVTQGAVIVTPPGGKPARLRGERAIALGSRVDTRAGRVRITAANDTVDGRLSGEFHGGVFVITQERRAPVTTVLRLAEDVGLAACPRSRSARASGKRRKKPGKRFLWGDGKGRFRTTGSYGSATVRGTRWLVQDSCAGTLVRVTRGVVDARDLGRRRTVRVRAGDAYLARPPR